MPATDAVANLTIDWRTYGPGPDLAAEFEALVKTKAEVIYAGGPAPIRAAQKATTTIPILALTERKRGGRGDRCGSARPLKEAPLSAHVLAAENLYGIVPRRSQGEVPCIVP